MLDLFFWGIITMLVGLLIGSAVNESAWKRS